MANSATRAALVAAILALCPLPAAAETGDDSESIEVQGATIGRMGDPVAVNPDEFEFSKAEDLLWMSDHLGNIDGPTRLHYEFVKSGTFEGGFTDSVYLDILRVNDDGTRDAEMQFFTGEREQPFSPDNVLHIRGNPVLGVYMRGDIYDMNRLTSGSWRYFQRAIKLAFANAATVEPVEFEFNGHTVRGEKVTIAPYLRDPHRRQFEQFSGKTYEFLLSADVPGTLYQIHTVIPGPADGPAEPLIQETLTLQTVEAGG